MSFASLPKSIINCVYLHLIKANEAASDWVTALPLLAVSHKWRKHLVPLVYSQVYFTSGSKLGTGFNTSKNISLSTSGKTNVGLVKQMNMSSRVTTVCMKFYYTQYFETLVTDFEQLFDFMNSDWSNVNSLNITIDSDVMSVDQSDKYAQMGEWFSSDIPKAMPSVNNINLVLRNTSPQNREIVKELVSNYALQLKTFNCTDSSIYFDAGIPDKLKELTIDLGTSSSKTMPSTIADSLEVLKIRNCPDTLDLGSLFGLNCNGKSKQIIINFPNLRKLSIDTPISTKEKTTKSPLNTMNTSQNDLAKVTFLKLKTVKLSIRSRAQFNDLFLSGRFEWPSVNILVLEILSGWDDIVDNTGLDCKEVEVLAKSISDNMPKIGQLEINKLPNGELADIFVNRLLNLYGNQLTHFYSSPRIRFNLLSFQPSLVYLDIELKNNSFIDVAKACTESLRNLTIRSVPQTFSWGAAQEIKKSSTIDFNCLEVLRVNYIQGSYKFIEFNYNAFIDACNGTTHGFQVNCPKVKKISVKNTSFSALRNLLSFGSNTWPNVKDLRLHFCHVLEGVNSHSNNKVDIDGNVIEHLIDSFGYNIVNAMPSITKLNVECQTRSPHLDRFLCILNSSYSDQLQRFSSTVPIPSEQLEYSDHLTELYTSVSNLNLLTTRRPSINHRTLHHMLLNDTCACFGWSWFDNCSENSNIILLDNLRSFKLVQSLKLSNKASESLINVRKNSTNGNQAVPRRIYAPNIQRFDLSIQKTNIIAGAAELYFKNAHQIKMAGPVSALPSRENPMSNILDDLTIEINEAEYNDGTHFYHLTNSWFGCRQPAGSSSLVLSHIAFELDPRSIRWFNVRKLVINCPLKITTLFCLLPEMKHLTEIKLSELVIDRQPVCVDNLDSLKRRPETVRPLSKSLESITVLGYTNDNSYEVMAASVTHLLLASTSLSRLKIKKFYMKTSDIVSQFKAYYPHICNVEFKE